MNEKTNEIIDRFWDAGEAEVGSGTSKLIARMRIFLQEHVFDTVLFDGEKLIGYAYMMKGQHGFNMSFANLENIRHQGLEERFGWGIEVHPDYRGRNIGHALLSLAIGYAQRDFSRNGGMADFVVRGSGISESNESFYQKFGFQTEHHDLGGKKPAISGECRLLDVPEINILDK